MSPGRRRIGQLVQGDVAVVGAGPAGIAAAVCAAAARRRVVVVDEAFAPGGQIWRHRPGAPAPAAAREWIARLRASGATLLSGTSVIDAQGESTSGFVLTAERQGEPCLVHAKRLVLATGARELFLPFPGWTLPGVVGVGGAQALLKSGTSFGGKRVVLAGTGPLLLPVAAALSCVGARIALVAEQASGSRVFRYAAGLWRRPAVALQAARYRLAFARARYATGVWVARVEGGDRVRAVVLTDGHAQRTIACDVLCTGYGLVPNTELARLLGCGVRDGAVQVTDRQETTVPGVYCAGEPTGIGGVELSLAEGRIAGRCGAGQESVPPGEQRSRARGRSAAAALERTFACRHELRALCTPDTIVCRCEDVPCGALRPQWSARQAKLYTRAGMGPCQGRVCGAALQFLYGWSADRVRLPVQPANISTILADAAVTASSTDQQDDGVA